ncbi:MAG TPA: amidase [Pyrinomonadaceae bacterium]
MSEELTSMSAVDLIDLMEERKVSPVEVVEAYLRRADELNGRLNAIVTFAPDVLEQARAAEQKIMDEEDGRLCGLPVTIKDTIMTNGIRTTAGSRLFAENVPERDAQAVGRLRWADAVILGKTNASELALDYECDNPVFGRTNNPHDLTRTAGGSSGGSAAAVAACLSAADIGSDAAGSVRIPAHFCGVVGLLPTAGRVPRIGHVPAIDAGMGAHVSFGPLTRTVEDAELMFNVLTWRRRAREWMSEEAEERLPKLRFAWYTDDGVAPVTAETAQATRAAADALRAHGLVGVEARPPHVERGPDLWLEIFGRGAQEQMRMLHEGREELAGPLARVLIRRGKEFGGLSDEEFARLNQQREQLRKELLLWMRETQLIVAPVGSVAAFPHGARRVDVDGQELSVWRAFGYAQTYNVFGLPSVSVPAGRTRAGLPVGVQIIGRSRAEGEVLAAARVVEEALGGWQRPPPVLSQDGGDRL